MRHSPRAPRPARERAHPHRRDGASGNGGAVPPWTGLWPLGVLALAVIALAAVGVLPRWSGLVHLVGLPPLDMFTDFRLLLAEPSSWGVALVWWVGALAARVVVFACALGGLTRANVALVARFYAIMAVPMLLAAFFSTTASTVLYARFFWPALAFLAVVVLACAPWLWQGGTRLRTRWRRTWSGALRVEVMVPYAGAIVILGVLARAAPVLTLPLVAVSAVVTAVAIRALHRRPVRHPRRLAMATAAAVAIAAVVLAGTRAAESPTPQPQSQEGSVLLMSGINSSSGRGAILEEDPAQMGFDCEQTYYFSYAGPGAGQPQAEAVCEITTGAPYDADDTMRPVTAQVEAFAAQTRDLPRPLVVTAHSHAAWIVWEALARDAAEVDVLVLVGPFADSPVGYPARGADGTGRVLGDLLRVAAPMADAVGFNFQPDEPGPQELLAQRNVSRQILGQEIDADVQVLSVTSAGDLPLMPGGWRLAVDRNACPVRTSHPNLPRAGAYVDEVNRFLAGAPGRECPPWRDWGTTAVTPFGAVYRW